MGGVIVVVKVLVPTVLVTVTAVTSNIGCKTSVTTTFGAGRLPRFLTVIVKTIVSPTDACVGEPALESAGSTKPGAGAWSLSCTTGPVGGCPDAVAVFK